MQFPTIKQHGNSYLLGYYPKIILLSSVKRNLLFPGAYSTQENRRHMNK